MTVYVLHNYWDTIDNEGNEILGVYRNLRDAVYDMKAEAAKVKSYYPVDYWDDDMTWEDDLDIHFGRNSRSYGEPARFMPGKSSKWR